MTLYDRTLSCIHNFHIIVGMIRITTLSIHANTICQSFMQFHGEQSELSDHMSLSLMISHPYPIDDQHPCQRQRMVPALLRFGCSKQSCALAVLALLLG